MPAIIANDYRNWQYVGVCFCAETSLYTRIKMRNKSSQELDFFRGKHIHLVCQGAPGPVHKFTVSRWALTK